MARARKLPGFDAEPTDARPEPTLTGQVMEWFNREYTEAQKWKDRGRKIYLSTSGDSAAARYYLADELRKCLSAETGAPAECAVWSTKSDNPVSTSIVPPPIDDSKTAYVDWTFLADYFLLPACVSWEALEQENQGRNQAYDRAVNNQDLRRKVKAAKDYILRNQKATNRTIAAALKKAGTPVAGLQLTIARHELAQGIHAREEKELEKPREIPLYSPLYF